MAKNISIFFSVLTLFLIGKSTLIFSQEMVFITQASASKIGINDVVEINYIIKNANGALSFNIQNLGDFKLVSAPQIREPINSYNRRTERENVITYLMKPTKTGKLNVPMGFATIGTRKIKSNLVTIDVVSGSLTKNTPKKRQQNNNSIFDINEDEDPFVAIRKAREQLLKNLQKQQQQARSNAKAKTSAPDEIFDEKKIDENLFIRVEADKTNVKLGEQIIVYYKLYSRIQMEVNLTKLPSLNNFWSQDFEIPYPPSPTREIKDGKEYQVFVIKKSALFPTQTGALTLDEAEAKGFARIKLSGNKQHSIDDIFESDIMDLSDFFFNNENFKDVPVVLKSKPVTIQVSDFDNNQKPISFKGAVGKYNMESNLDKTDLTTDDVATLTLTISGVGNVKLIEAPSVKFPSNTEVFDPLIEDTLTKLNDQIGGYKKIKYRFTPQQIGEMMIAPISFTYFDTETNQYQTLETPSYKINVKQGKKNKVANKHRSILDIHGIENSKIELTKNNAICLPNNIWYWSGFGIPFLAYLGIFFFKKKEEKLRDNKPEYKHKLANKIALQRVSKAAQYLKDDNKNAFYEEISKSLWLYCSDKLNIPLAKLSKEKAKECFNEKNIPSSLSISFFELADDCEKALYMPKHGINQMHQTYADTLKIIGKLEEHLN